MKKSSLYALIVFMFFNTVSIYAYSQDDKRQTIQASYVLVLGRIPEAGEVNYWMGLNNYSLKEYVDIHYKGMANDVNTKRSVIRKAYNDAYGRNPTDGEYTFWVQYNQSYTELMKRFVEGLTPSSPEYDAVIKRSYKFVYNREPTTAEVNFWKIKTYSYIILVGLHEEYKRQFGTGRESSAINVVSINTGSLKGVVLNSNAVKQVGNYLTNMFGANSVIPVNGASVIASGGLNVIASGGLNVIATGGLNVIASGGLN